MLPRKYLKRFKYIGSVSERLVRNKETQEKVFKMVKVGMNEGMKMKKVNLGINLIKFKKDQMASLMTRLLQSFSVISIINSTLRKNEKMGMVKK